MTLPRKTKNGVEYARFTTRGVLTRMALMFQANRDRTFTGDEVAQILVRGVVAIGRPGENGEETGLPETLSRPRITADSRDIPEGEARKS